MKCLYEICKLNAKTAGYCVGHYAQKHKGKDLKPLYNHMSLQERIEEHMRWENECLIWDHRLDSSGYPQIKYQGGQRLVHRAYYEIMIRPLHKHESIDHLCRNKTCINLNHLEPVSNSENVKRMLAANFYEKEIERLKKFIVSLGYNPHTLEKE